MTDFTYSYTVTVTDESGQTSQISDTVTFDFPAQGCYIDRAITNHHSTDGQHVINIDR